MNLYTLVLICDGTRVLLGRKQRGFGAGLWNGFGGGVKVGETLNACAQRETSEECGLTPLDLTPCGTLSFREIRDDRSVHEGRAQVYRATQTSGTLSESEEMKELTWWQRETLPYAEMFPDNVHWFPWVFDDRPFHAEVVLASGHRLVSCTVTASNGRLEI